jgi:hypothetical protein
MWFEKLTGFIEESPEQVRANFDVIGNKLISKINQAELQYGNLETPSLGDLRKLINLDDYNSKIKVSQVVGNVQTLHCEEENNGALFQAASQFNLLEMVGPHVSPERGVGIYENDFTQGPACAIACGAGTIYRNYFAKVRGLTGQSFSNQIDCLEDISKELENSKLDLWQMTNGYALPTSEGLRRTTALINSRSPKDLDDLKCLLRIGIQWNSEVTINESQNVVSQAYCSALPVQYSNIESVYWESFARLVLEATYESTLYAGLINLKSTGNNIVYLTLVGGGAFGNDLDWIFQSMEKAIEKFKHTPLDLRIVSFGGSNKAISDFTQPY